MDSATLRLVDCALTSPLTATGAVLLFVGAVITRLRRGEKIAIVADLIYLSRAASVTRGRFGEAPGHSPLDHARRLGSRSYRGASASNLPTWPVIQPVPRWSAVCSDRRR